MENQLVQCLKKMSDLDYIVLTHHIKMADWVRSLMRTYNVKEVDMAAKLGITTKAQMKAVLNGAYPFDIKFLSRIQVVDIELHKQAAEKKFPIDIVK